MKYDSQKVGCQRHGVSSLTAVQSKQIRPTDRSGNADMREINAMSPAKVDNNDIQHCSLWEEKKQTSLLTVLIEDLSTNKLGVLISCTILKLA